MSFALFVKHFLQQTIRFNRSGSFEDTFLIAKSVDLCLDFLAKPIQPDTKYS